MLKIITMISMTISHVGLVFFDNNEYLRLIGSIAFPLYCIGIVKGYQKYKNYVELKKYFRFLFVLALFSQIPFMIAFETTVLNILFAYSISLIFLYSLDNHKLFISIPVTIIIAFIIDCLVEYGLYVVILILLFRYLEHKKFLLIMCHLILNIFYFVFFGWNLKIINFIGTIIFLERKRFYNFTINKNFYRLFYPGHLLVISILKVLLIR